jgi:2',3'-cyclic-nucleotide 2'-phosphodiesterase (5'-nucleotidase family)
MNRFGRIFLLVFPILAFSLACNAQQVSFTIMHTNDTHGHLMPFSYPADGSAAISGMRVRENIGGIARRASLARTIRSEVESRGGTAWLVDAGDFTDGTVFSTVYHGDADVEAMNAAGYTFSTIGNHELNASIATLKKFLGLAKFPVLCANLTENATGKLLVKPYEIRRVGPLKVGVFGITTVEAATYPAGKEGLTIAPEVETARKMTAALRQEANLIVLISHAGENIDEQIANDVPGIDIIIGGHTHTRLPVGELVWHSDVLQARSVNGTIIVQDHQWGGELGRLDLLIEKDKSGVWQIDRYRERLIPVTSKIAEDPQVAEVVNRYWNPIAAKYGEVVGKAAGDFVERGDDMANYNLVADAVREIYGAEICLENTGGVRAPITKGDITLAELNEVDPFGNTVVTFTISGQKLKEVLLKNRPAVSGVRYRIENKQLVEVFVNGKAVEDGRMYSGVSNSYFAGGGLKDIKVVDTKKPRLDAIVEYIRKKGTVQPLYDGRRIIVD